MSDIKKIFSEIYQIDQPNPFADGKMVSHYGIRIGPPAAGNIKAFHFDANGDLQASGTMNGILLETPKGWTVKKLDE